MKLVIPCVSKTFSSSDEHIDIQNSKKESALMTWFRSVTRKKKRVSISGPIKVESIDNDANHNQKRVQDGSHKSLSVEEDNCLVKNHDSIVKIFQSSENIDRFQTKNNENNKSSSSIAHTANSKKSTVKFNPDIVNGWFWGAISRRDAEILLRDKEDGTFLVRESSHSRFVYSLTFRSNGKTMHTRIERVNGMYNFHSADSVPNDSNKLPLSDGCKSLTELINDTIRHNQNDGVFFYSRNVHSESSLYTVSLNQPLSRYQYLVDFNYDSNENKSLQYMCKFLIQHSPSIREQMKSQMDTFSPDLKQFLEDPFYFPPFKKSC